MATEQGPLQDFLDAVKEAKRNGQQRVEYEYTFTNLFDKKLPDVPKVIDVEVVEVETKLLDK